MPHIKTLLGVLIHRAQNESRSVGTHAGASNWSQPGDVFSVLLILGGDIVSRALAQLVGSTVTPVAFSFGMSKSDHNFQVVNRY
jgi:hypothetical protein